MKTPFLIAAAFLAGCENESVSLRVVQCFSEAAYATLEKLPSPDAPRECCGECKGTGLVRSGDKLEWVPCPCPDDCECKTKSCKDGKCAVKRK
jgi:hypothetical protein